ncbi:MAG: VWA domain-containing protein [Acidobacteria bacterium]|nr:VWA domain-containing protein [Acidobacteriota bacterium]
MRRPITRRAVVVALALLATMAATGQAISGQEGFRFKSGVELINVTATVTDRSGRFVPNLRQSDFVVYEDDRPVEVTHFSAERVPVSLGIVLDTSGSMAGEKIYAARDAIGRFLNDLLDRDDEVFLYTFDADVLLVHDWTKDKGAVSNSLRRVQPNGGTAMYDGIVEAVPMADTGRNRKKAVIVISDGNDTSSHADAREVKQVVRETEVLVYAIGIDGTAEPTVPSRPPIFRPPSPIPFPFPGVGGRGRGTPWPTPPPQYPPGRGGGAVMRGADRLNVAALREITDDSGGRTEVVRDARDIDPATANIADELSKQYYLGYTSQSQRDGRWHTIRVELRDPSLRVRARRGYMATP